MADLVSHSLCTLAQVKESLDIDNTNDDNLLKRLINAATEQIENFCNRRFASTSYSDELYSGDSGHYLFLENAPVTTLTKVEYMTGDYASPKWESYESDFYHIDTNDTGNAGIIYNRVPFYKGVNNIRVNYTAGYDEIPDDVEGACIDLVAYNFKKRKSQGIKSEKLGDRSVSYFENTSKSSAFDDLALDDVLMQYRLFDENLGG